jgi:High potential iron-sulfur protein
MDLNVDPPKGGSTRRALLLLAVAGPALAAAGAAAAESVCVDVSALPSGQRSMREAMNFKMASDDPKQVCGGCAFFTATDGGCGKCTIFSGPVPAQGHCDSWAAAARK